LRQMRIEFLGISFIFFTLSMTACSYLPESAGQNITMEAGGGRVIQGIVNSSDQVLTAPAQTGADFVTQVTEYMNDLVMAGAELQGEMQIEFKPEEWQQGIEEKLSTYDAALKRAMSIPKPQPQLYEFYRVYMEIVRQYEKLPGLVRKGIEDEDSKMIEVAFAQIQRVQEQYNRLIQVASQDSSRVKAAY
jgi:hypothetical protein